VTANGNTFMRVGTAVDVGPQGTLIGRDNTFDQIVHAVSIDLDATADLRFNDFIGPITDIGLSPSTAILTCNYWGNPMGPQVFPVGLETIFTAFATEPIARTGASGC